MKLSTKQIEKLRKGGARVKRTEKPKPEIKEEKAAPPQVNVAAPTQEIPDYGPELKELIASLDNKLDRPRMPWRIKVNRTRSGLAESYDLIPIETD